MLIFVIVYFLPHLSLLFILFLFQYRPSLWTGSDNDWHTVRLYAEQDTKGKFYFIKINIVIADVHCVARILFQFSACINLRHC